MTDVDPTYLATIRVQEAVLANEWHLLLRHLDQLPVALLGELRHRLTGPEFPDLDGHGHGWRMLWLEAFTEAVNHRQGVEVYPSPLPAPPDDLSGLEAGS